MKAWNTWYITQGMSGQDVAGHSFRISDPMLCLHSNIRHNWIQNAMGHLSYLYLIYDAYCYAPSSKDHWYNAFAAKYLAWDNNDIPFKTFMVEFIIFSQVMFLSDVGI